MQSNKLLQAEGDYDWSTAENCKRQKWTYTSLRAPNNSVTGSQAGNQLCVCSGTKGDMQVSMSKSLNLWGPNKIKRGTQQLSIMLFSSILHGSE